MAVQDPRVFIHRAGDPTNGHRLFTLPATSPMIQAFKDNPDMRELDAAEYTAYNGGSHTWKAIRGATSNSHGECP